MVRSTLDVDRARGIVLIDPCYLIIYTVIVNPVTRVFFGKVILLYVYIWHLLTR